MTSAARGKSRQSRSAYADGTKSQTRTTPKKYSIHTDTLLTLFLPLISLDLTSQPHNLDYRTRFFRLARANKTPR
jgi:hypothetical protein